MIKLARDGNLDAFDELMKLYYPVVQRFAFQIGNPADVIDDVTQEVFLRVYRYLHRYSRGKLSTWLYKITLNVSKDMARKRKRTRALTDVLQSQPQETTAATEGLILKDEQDQQLHMLIQQMDDKYKIPLILHYFHDKKLKDIAKVMNLPMATVKTRLLRAKSKLKTAVEEGVGNDGEINF